MAARGEVGATAVGFGPAALLRSETGATSAMKTEIARLGGFLAERMEAQLSQHMRTLLRQLSGAAPMPMPPSSAQAQPIGTIAGAPPTVTGANQVGAAAAAATAESGAAVPEAGTTADATVGLEQGAAAEACL